MKWRRKRQRKPARPTAARLERERSDRLRDEAMNLVRQLHEIRHQNHFAESLRNFIEGDG